MALSGDDIILSTTMHDGQHLKPFVVNLPLTLRKNLTFRSVHGKSIITGNSSYFLNLQPSLQNETTSVMLSNIHFVNIGAAYIKYGALQMYNCTVSNTSLAVIHVNNTNSREDKKQFTDIELNDTVVQGGKHALLISHYNNLTISIMHSIFHRSYGIRILQHNIESKINITAKHSKFVEVRELLYATKSPQAIIGNRYINFRQCMFHGNSLAVKTQGQSSMYVYKVKLFISQCNFTQNIGKYGGALSALVSTIQVKNTNFVGNRAWNSGGAVCLRHSNATFKDCNFIRNEILSSDSDKVTLKSEAKFTGVGGAVMNEFISGNYIQSPLLFQNCIFKENKASTFGGGIFHLGFGASMLLRDCLIETHPYVHLKSEVVGGFLYSVGTCEFDNITVKSSPLTNLHESLIVHNGLYNGGFLYPNRNSSIYCSTGSQMSVKEQYITTINGFIPLNAFSYLSISCSPCYSTQYNLKSSHTELTPLLLNGHKVYPITCYPCPFGGSCKNGKIRAADHFWGYKLNSFGEVRFQFCPTGYCCNGLQCTSYNSCSPERKGTFCSRCLNTYTEDIVSRKCVPDWKCQRNLFWIIMLLIGFVYVFSFMYLKEIKNMVDWALGVSILTEKVKLFIVKSPKYALKKPAYRSQISVEKPLLVQKETDHPCSEGQSKCDCTNELSHGSKERLKETSNMLESSRQNIRSSGVMFSGLLKIAIFFYQAEFLSSDIDPPNMENSSSLMHKFKDTISKILNLKPQSLFSTSISWCPIKGIYPVENELVRLALIFYLWGSLAFVFFISSAAKIIWKRSGSSPSKYRTNSKPSMTLQTRVLCTFLQFLLFAYSSLTITIFRLLSCISLGPDRYVLFIDGNVSCDPRPWWHFILYGVTGVWIVPFPLALIVVPNLLRKRKIGLGGFFVGLILPGPLLVVSSLLWLCVTFQRATKSKSYQSSDHGTSDKAAMSSVLETEDEKWKDRPLETGGRRELESNNDIFSILAVLEGPFRKGNENSWTENHPIPWESVLIGRRLLLIGIQLLVYNTVVQAYVITIFLVLFIIHHLTVLPFSNRFLNIIETGSLVSLCTLCLINIIPAYNYIYPTTSAFNFHDISSSQENLKLGILLIIPFAVLFFVSTFVIVRLVTFVCKAVRSLLQFCLQAFVIRVLKLR